MVNIQNVEVLAHFWVRSLGGSIQTVSYVKINHLIPPLGLYLLDNLVGEGANRVLDTESKLVKYWYHFKATQGFTIYLFVVIQYWERRGTIFSTIGKRLVVPQQLDKDLHIRLGTVGGKGWVGGALLVI